MNMLNAHNTEQLAIFLISPEYDTLIHLMPKRIFGHVGFFPTVRRDDPSIRFGRLIDDRVDHLRVSVVAFANHELPPRSRVILTMSAAGEDFASDRSSPARLIDRSRGCEREILVGMVYGSLFAIALKT